MREAQLEPKEVRLQIDRNNGKSKGFAYIEFNTVEARDKCIQVCNDSLDFLNFCSSAHV